MQSVKKIFSAAFIMTLLATQTAHAGMIKKSEKTAIQTGQYSGLIMSVTKSGKCNGGEVTFRNLQTRKFHTGSFSNGTFLTKVPYTHYIALPPGYYQPLSIKCREGSRSIKVRNTYRGLDRLYQPVFVGPGELVYSGTFDVQTDKRVKGFNVNLVGNPHAVYQGVMKTDSDLARHFVVRPIQRKW